MKVVLPSPLASYTGGLREVEAEGASIAEVLAQLDRRYPGLGFRLVDEQDRIRPHIKIFVNRAQAPGIGQRLQPGDEVIVVAALSGG
jgi:molybdopterin converting factor small subunit